MPTAPYPGRAIRLGEKDARVVKIVKTALNRALAVQRRPELRLDPDNPNFGPTTKQAVQLNPMPRTAGTRADRAYQAM